MNTLLLIRGLPGTGKSTLAHTLSATGYQHIEADMFFVDEHGEYKFDLGKLSDAHTWCLNKTSTTLKEGKMSVVVANTFSTRWEMDPYEAYAKIYGYRFQVVETKLRFQNIHDVPQIAIDRMIKRWEKVYE